MKKIIWFYFLYELLKELLNLWGQFYLTTISNCRIVPGAGHISKFSWGTTPKPPQGEVATHKSINITP